MFECYKNKKVMITGITGFKGSWMYLWLKDIGAEVSGFGLLPNSSPSMYEILGMSGDERVSIGDIRDKNYVVENIKIQKPEIIFHLAAQPLVNVSYENPEETFEINITGLINLFEALKNSNSVTSLVVVTSDKCYRNSGEKKKFTEDDALGGIDPYSASKSCAEIITSSYANTIINEKDIYVSSVRAGNIIGGGDWSRYRLIPDIVRAIISKTKLVIRYPNSIRPWQYVLDALRGYLIVGERLINRDIEKVSTFNFGPADLKTFNVLEIAKILISTFDKNIDELIEIENPKYYESDYLQLDSTKANKVLKWNPLFDIEKSIKSTSEWYKDYYSSNKPKEISIKHLKEYIKLLNI
ncbi:MAG: CDP-glucose 4,6-dehydratase [Ignavibacteriae bacterium]|nr:CDP-glucose 4,6-dehydratase [Ignavibacteriota bacterium]